VIELDQSIDRLDLSIEWLAARVEITRHSAWIPAMASTLLV
jgi:hypothetical protein